MKAFAPILGVVLATVAGCNNEDEVVLRQFNNATDAIQVEITVGPVGPATVVDLTSNTGAVIIGSATVEPGSGPVGTNHLLLIEVADEWQDRIEVAQITSIGERGTEEYDLRQDAADPGFFDLTLTSLGDEGEARTDTWSVTLWEPIDAPIAEFEEEQPSE